MALTGIERQAVIQFVSASPAASHSALDCSHFVWQAIKSVRADFPYMTSQQYAQALTATSQPLPADLVYFPDLPHIAIAVLSNGVWFVGSQTSTGPAAVKADNVWWKNHPRYYLQVP